MHRPRPEQGRRFCPLLAIRRDICGDFCFRHRVDFRCAEVVGTLDSNQVASRPFDFRSGQAVRFLDEGKRTAYL